LRMAIIEDHALFSNRRGGLVLMCWTHLARIGRRCEAALIERSGEAH
jgi:hypothetical protein